MFRTHDNKVAAECGGVSMVPDLTVIDDAEYFGGVAFLISNDVDSTRGIMGKIYCPHTMYIYIYV